MSSNEPKLDFIGVGAEKCGTTWLTEMLWQHPQVFIPAQKEIHYFNRKFGEFPDLDNYNFDKPLVWYLSFFKNAKPDQVKGEICPSYLWDEQAAGRIRDFDPNIKILIVLRNPIERTFSAYRFYMQRGLIHTDFRQALEKYKSYLLTRSLYYPQVKRYFDLFPRQNILVMLYDDLRANSASFLGAVEKFLGVSEFLPANINQESYITGEARFGPANAFLIGLRRFAHKHRLTFLLDLSRNLGLSSSLEAFRQNNNMQRKRTDVNKMSEEERQWLCGYFHDDIRNLESLLNRDLGAWN